jgi:hypothetical protein
VQNASVEARSPWYKQIAFYLARKLDSRKLK